MVDVQRIFDETDTLVHQFMECFKDRWNDTMSWTIPGRNVTVEASPFKIFTHVMTHEFHHKGQIVSMSRQLGHTPSDTDIIRF